MYTHTASAPEIDSISFQQFTKSFLLKNICNLTELSCKSGIYSERGPKGPDF